MASISDRIEPDIISAAVRKLTELPDYKDWLHLNISQDPPGWLLELAKDRGKKISVRFSDLDLNNPRQEDVVERIRREIDEAESAK